jgi:hypothetical protein
MVQLVTRTLTKWLFLEGLIPYTAQRQMAIRRFCLQMTQCSRMSHSGLLIGLMYVQRILKSGILNQCSELGILTIGFILADIQINDCTISMNYWSKISGIQTQELCQMKQKVLIQLNFDTFIPQEQYNQFVNAIQWMNYTQKPMETIMAMPIYDLSI